MICQVQSQSRTDDDYVHPASSRIIETEHLRLGSLKPAKAHEDGEQGFLIIQSNITMDAAVDLRRNIP